MSVFGIVTTQHSTEYTVECLRSFLKTTPLRPDDRCFLIDNDGAFPVTEVPPSFSLVRNTTPRSFSENGNFLLKKSRELEADLFFLNNDLVLTPGWREILGSSPTTISSPLSTREVSYTAAVTVDKTQHVQGTFRAAIGMRLEDYRGNEAAFEFIAAAHQRTTPNKYLPALVVPFFCVRIPATIAMTVGDFDTKFGIGGGEDYDYCLRAILAGFSVQYCLASYILHFGGKSTWSGPETREAQLERERLFRGYFQQKWGARLTRFILQEDDKAFDDTPELKSLIAAGELAKLIQGACHEKTS